MSIKSKEELLEQIAAGKQFGYLFFWGHRQPAGGGVGPSCCSQWFAAGFDIEGIHYPTVEHYMMAEKAKLFGDDDMGKKILAAETPDKAKGFGRKVKNFDHDKWEQNCFDIVVAGNIAKFSQNRKLGNWLCGTAPQVLVEASPVDPIWGIGLHRDDPRAQNPQEWPGTNRLGFALMVVRQHLLSKADS